MNEFGIINLYRASSACIKNLKSRRSCSRGNSIAFSIAIVMTVAGLLLAGTPLANAAVPAECRQVSNLLQSNKLKKANRAVTNSKECGYLVASALYPSAKAQNYPERRVQLIRKLFRWSEQKLSRSSSGYPDYLEALIKVGFDPGIGLKIKKVEKLRELKGLIDPSRYQKLEKQIEAPYLTLIQRQPFKVSCPPVPGFSTNITNREATICQMTKSVRSECGGGTAGLQLERLVRCQKAIEVAGALRGINSFRQRLRAKVTALYVKVQRQTKNLSGPVKKDACKDLRIVAALAKDLRMGIGSGGEPPQCQSMVSDALNEIEARLAAINNGEEENNRSTVANAFRGRPFRLFYRSCVVKLPNVRIAVGEDTEVLLAKFKTPVSGYLNGCATAMAELHRTLSRSRKWWVKFPPFSRSQVVATRSSRPLTRSDIRIGLLTAKFKNALPNLAQYLEDEASLFAKVLSHRLRTFSMATQCSNGEREELQKINKILSWNYKYKPKKADTNINGAKKYLVKVSQQVRNALTLEAFELVLWQYETSFQRWKTCGEDGTTEPVRSAEADGSLRRGRNAPGRSGNYRGGDFQRPSRAGSRALIPPRPRRQGQAAGRRTGPSDYQQRSAGNSIAATLVSVCRQIGIPDGEQSRDAVIADLMFEICELRNYQTDGASRRQIKRRLSKARKRIRRLLEDLRDY